MHTDHNHMAFLNTKELISAWHNPFNWLTNYQQKVKDLWIGRFDTIFANIFFFIFLDDVPFQYKYEQVLWYRGS